MLMPYDLIFFVTNIEWSKVALNRMRGGHIKPMLTIPSLADSIDQ